MTINFYLHYVAIDSIVARSRLVPISVTNRAMLVRAVQKRVCMELLDLSSMRKHSCMQRSVERRHKQQWGRKVFYGRGAENCPFVKYFCIASSFNFYSSVELLYYLKYLMTFVNLLPYTIVEYLDLIDHLHWLDAAVAGGLSPPTFFSRDLQPPLPP